MIGFCARSTFGEPKKDSSSAGPFLIGVIQLVTYVYIYICTYIHFCMRVCKMVSKRVPCPSGALGLISGSWGREQGSTFNGLEWLVNLRFWVV